MAPAVAITYAMPTGVSQRGGGLKCNTGMSESIRDPTAQQHSSIRLLLVCTGIHYLEPTALPAYVAGALSEGLTVSANHIRVCCEMCSTCTCIDSLVYFRSCTCNHTSWPRGTCRTNARTTVAVPQMSFCVMQPHQLAPMMVCVAVTMAQQQQHVLALGGKASDLCNH